MPSIKFKIMQNQSFKSTDDLILGIKTILSNYRCSFSDEEQVLLNECINKFEESKAEPDLQKRLQASVKAMGTLLRIFTIIDHLKDLF
jgi:hypothetical protein